MTTMRDHLTEEVLLDVLEGLEGDEARAHAAGCAECARRLEEARAGLALARDAQVPEPSPQFWESFRGQVGRRLPSPGSRFARPAFLAPLLAAAAAVAVALWLPSRDLVAPEPGAAGVLPAWSALPPAEGDASLEVLAAVVPMADDALGASCRGAAACLAELTDEESAALTEALRQELPRAREL